MVYIWLIVAFFFLFFEMLSPGLFYFLSFFFGGAVAALATLFVEDIFTQIIFFFVGSIIAFFGLKYWISKEDEQLHKTNVQALQGKQGLVLREITPNAVGSVKVGGEIWSAKSLHHDTIAQGTTVDVVRVQGAHLIVKLSK